MALLSQSYSRWSICLANGHGRSQLTHRKQYQLQQRHNQKILGMSVTIQPEEKWEQVRFDLPTFLETKRISIAAALDAAIPIKYPNSIYESMRYSIFAESSRICPLLCISACELVGGTEDLAMAMACALEMVHTASFMHDDLPCMDDDELRRGKPANHKVFGEDLAILAGDALYALGMEHVAKNTTGVSSDKLLKIIAVLGKAVGSEGMVAGQYLELASEGGESLRFEDIRDIHLRKTGAYAECSTVCGAILGGADEEQIESLRQYGQALGLLYEVVDDIAEQKNRQASQKLSPSYVRLLGLQKCIEYGRQLRQQAKSQLSNFDAKKALPLLCFVDELYERVQATN